MIFWLYRAIQDFKLVNEPAPENYPAARVEGYLLGFGLSAHVERVLYVNRDYNGYIFQGTVSAPQLVLPSGAGPLEEEMSASEFQKSFPTHSGTLLHSRRKKVELWAIVLSTQGEWAQAKPAFMRKWMDLTGANPQ